MYHRIKELRRREESAKIEIFTKLLFIIIIYIKFNKIMFFIINKIKINNKLS